MNSSLITHRRRKVTVWYLCAMIVVIGLSGGLQAQPTRIVEVEITCVRPSHELIGVVLDGDESHPLTAEWVSGSLWRGRIPGGKTKDAARTHTASLRLGGKRTECLPSLPPDHSVIRFSFQCASRPAQKVTFLTNPDDHVNGNSIAMGYVRILPKCKVDCRESAYFDMGPITAADVWSNEILKLQVGAVHGVEAPGVLVFSPDESDKRLLTFSSAVERQAKKTAEGMIFEAKGILLVLKDQRAMGHEGSAPNFSETAIDVDNVLLKNAKVEKLVITVQ